MNLFEIIEAEAKGNKKKSLKGMVKNGDLLPVEKWALKKGYHFTEMQCNMCLYAHTFKVWERDGLNYDI